MIIAWLRKLIRICLACATVVVAAIGVAVWLAFQQPAFYADLIGSVHTPQEQSQAEADLKQTLFFLEVWIAKGAQQDDGKALLVQAFVGPQVAAMKKQGTIDAAGNIAFSQNRINALLASNDSARRGLRMCRILLEDDQFRIAGTVDIPDVGSFLLSSTLRPSLNNTGEFKIDILDVCIGRLPVPIGLLLDWLPEEVTELSSELRLDKSGELPCLLINLDGADEGLRAIRNIRSRRGYAELELVDPAV